MRRNKLCVRTLLMIALASASSLAFPADGSKDNARVPVAPPSPESLGITFVNGSTNHVVVERDGKTYDVNIVTHEIREIAAPATAAESSSVQSQHQPAEQDAKQTKPADNSAEPVDYYRPADDLVLNLPTGRRLTRHSATVNFTHRFPYSPAFTGTSRGHFLGGLDDFGIPSFGFQYGVTNRLSVSVYRSPSVLGRPIELGTRFDLLQESEHAPFNAALRFSIDGQNDFSRNFTENFELIASRSIGTRAQFYVVPTASINNRPTLGAISQLVLGTPAQPCSQALANAVPASLHVKPCANTFSLGVGIAVDVRPTVTLIAEAIPTLVNGTELGIHRAPFSFGIQKKIWHHGFTFGLSTGPGTIVSQRIATRAIYLRDPHGDTPDKMFFGFNIMRQF